MRKIKEADLVGKTIESIDNKSVNVLRLNFTDDSFVEIWVEQAVHTSFGSIPGFFVFDSSLEGGNDNG
jgi:hypothetical protein